MRISDWSSDVCSSDLRWRREPLPWPTPQPWSCELPASVPSAHVEEFGEILGNTRHGSTRHRSCDGFRLILTCRFQSRFGVDDQIGRASCRERVCQYV